MRVFKLGIADSAARLMIKDKAIAAQVSGLLGSTPLDSSQWQPPTAVRFPKSGREFKDISCILSHSAYLAFSAPVREVMETEMGITSDWLELNVESQHYSLLNLQHQIDALDLSRATIRRLPSGRILSIDVYAFVPEKLDAQWLFKLTTRPYDVLCTDRFVQMVKAQGWSGIHAQPLWDSGVTPFPCGPTVKEVAERPDVFGPEGFVTGFEGVWPDEWR